MDKESRDTADHTLESDVSPPADALDRIETSATAKTLSERPAFLDTTLHEIAFVSTLTFAAVLVGANNGSMNIALPHIGSDLDISGPALNWVVSAYPLVTSCVLLLFGRLADLFGRRRMMLGGTSWMFIWSLVAGFAQDDILLDFCRGLMGLGGAAMLPSAIGLLGRAYQPGPRRNKAFAAFGSGAPLGFVIGLIVGGVCAEWIGWRWIFHIVAILCCCLTALTFVVIPRDAPRPEGAKKPVVDYLGALLSTSGLILLVYSLTAAPDASRGWKTPYIIVLLVVSVFLLASFLFWQHRMGMNALMPLSIWKLPSFAAVNGVVFLGWAAFGINSLYATLVFQDIEGNRPILTTAKFLPMAIVGTLVNVIAAFIVGRIKGRYILLVGLAGFTIAPMLFALWPRGLIYWAMHFPALCLIVVGADLCFNVANLFIQSSVPPESQALAGGIFNTVTNCATSFGLGLAATVSGSITGDSTDKASLLKGYRGAFWLGTGLSAVGFICCCLFVRVGVAAKRRGRVEPKPKTEEEKVEETLAEESGVKTGMANTDEL
ncbi:hypothetical protein YB2330_004925 [Saitoella coloradoensis]